MVERKIHSDGPPISDGLVGFLVYLSGVVPIRLLLLPIVFDDLRETGIRDGIEAAIGDLRTQHLLSQSEFGKSLLHSLVPQAGVSSEAAALYGKILMPYVFLPARALDKLVGLMRTDKNVTGCQFR